MSSYDPVSSSSRGRDPVGGGSRGRQAAYERGERAVRDNGEAEARKRAQLAQGIAEGTMSMAQVYAAIRDMRFRRGGYQIPDAEGPGVGAGVTPSEALAQLHLLTTDQLEQLQANLKDAGFMVDDSGQPVAFNWGMADHATRTAYMNFFAYAYVYGGDRTMSAILTDFADRHIMTRGGEIDARAGVGTGGGEKPPPFQATLTDPASLSQMIDDIGQDLFGRFVAEDRKAGLIAGVHENQTRSQRSAYEATYGNLDTATPAGVDPTDLEAFMTALAGQESGGSYGARNARTGAYGRFQIMPKNWSAWARRAGLESNAPQTPQNQELVARTIIGDYFREYGNWRDVAIAWYAGPGAVKNNQNRNRTQGGGREPSINRYADTVMARMSGIKSEQVLVPGAGLPPGVAANYTVDPDAELRAALKAQDPAGWQAHEFADRATEFFGLLASPV